MLAGWWNFFGLGQVGGLVGVGRVWSVFGGFVVFLELDGGISVPHFHPKVNCFFRNNK
jgi:hypothetical protein